METFEEAMELLSKPPARPVKGRGHRRRFMDGSTWDTFSDDHDLYWFVYEEILAPLKHAALLAKKPPRYESCAMRFWHVSPEAAEALNKFPNEFAALAKLTQ